MVLEEFKKIFFVEWIHRFYGSSLGFLFGVPLISFTLLSI
jgi:heme A synthase